MAGFGQTESYSLRLIRAGQRSIVGAEPVIPLENTEFDSDGLADAGQGVKLTPCRRPRPTAFRPSNEVSFHRFGERNTIGREILWCGATELCFEQLPASSIDEKRCAPS
jgi:hypothetical protein